jgi:hypothetical protein
MLTNSSAFGKSEGRDHATSLERKKSQQSQKIATKICAGVFTDTNTQHSKPASHGFIIDHATTPLAMT